MKEAIAYFDLSMTCRCPWCHHEHDLEEMDEDDNWFMSYFRRWANNESNKISEILDCEKCGERFLINRIER